MGGFFGAVSNAPCVEEIYYGTDYHTHLGTRRGGMAMSIGNDVIRRRIHDITNTPFRTKFNTESLELFEQCTCGIGVISDDEDQPLVVTSKFGTFAIVTVGKINNIQEIIDREMADGLSHLSEYGSGEPNPTEVAAMLICRCSTLEEGIARAQKSIDGSLSLLILHKGAIYAARDRFGRTPVIIGRRENAPGKERTLSDFYVTFPFGNFDFSVGYVDNHFGWKFKDNQDGSVLIGRMVGNETKSYRVFRTLAEQPTPPNEQLKGWVDGLVQSALGALLGETRSEPFQWMVGAANGMRGKLLQTDGTRYEGTTRDSAGNIIPEKVSEQTGSVDSILWGSISVTKRRTQIGTHVRKQSLATFPMPFEGNYLGISFTVGQSSE